MCLSCRQHDQSTGTKHWRSHRCQAHGPPAGVCNCLPSNLVAKECRFDNKSTGRKTCLTQRLEHEGSGIWWYLTILDTCPGPHQLRRWHTSGPWPGDLLQFAKPMDLLWNTMGVEVGIEILETIQEVGQEDWLNAYITLHYYARPCRSWTMLDLHKDTASVSATLKRLKDITKAIQSEEPGWICGNQRHFVMLWEGLCNLKHFTLISCYIAMHI